MSVIYFEDEKFDRVLASLSWLRTQPYVHIGNWADRTSDELAKFVEDLARANAKAYARRYEEGDSERFYMPNGAKPYPNLCAFLKSLHSIRYNIDATVMPVGMDKLENLISHIERHLIDQLPEYQAADWSD